MATIRLQIPDAWLPRLVDAICHVYGYIERDDDGRPNPETKGQFAERIIREFLKRTVMQSEGEIAAQKAALAAQKAVEDQFQITG